MKNSVAARQARRDSGREAAAARKYHHSEKGKAYRKRAHRKRMETNKAIIREEKNRPCLDCGGVFPPCCMDFHHSEGNKEFPVGKMITRSTPVLRREIAKCVVICANCHRIRHHGQV